MQLSCALSALLSAAVLAAPPPAQNARDILSKRDPPNVPSGTEARTLLSSLHIATPQDDGSYDRDLFPHWSAVEGETNCNTREFVLRRDGDDVEVGNDCYPVSGSWTSFFDGETHTQPPDVSIDHLVPLKNAWISGASEWTTPDREAFANDLDSPQLWAMTATVNSEKGDSSPDEWTPPLESSHCVYAAAWIAVKDKYGLSATDAEVEALGGMLDTC